jgi:7-dehydrocholesterol reductase
MTEKKSWGEGGLFQNRVLGSLLLMLIPPVFCLTFLHVCNAHNGSFSSLWNEVLSMGPFNVLQDKILSSPFDLQVWKVIFSYMGFELLLMRVVPGKTFLATPTPSGHVPVYKANGVQCYIITVLTLFAIYHYELYPLSFIYDNMGKFIASMNLFALCFCTFLSYKGLNFPSTADSGTNGNAIIDFYWGTELYPRILGWDVKQFTNSRFGMMFWQVGIICFAIKQYETVGYVSSSMLVSVLIQSVYIAKFFWWETGYFCSMDIQHDRAGFYICWGCLVWLPSMYTIHTYFLVNHPQILSVPMTLIICVAGILSIWCNYDCDR